MLWRDLVDEHGEFLVELVDRFGEVADPSDLVAGDPDASADRSAFQAAVDLLLPASADQYSFGDLPLGPQIVQLPAQLVDQPGASVDQPLAVDRELADLELRPHEPGGRKSHGKGGGSALDVGCGGFWRWMAVVPAESGVS